MDNPETQATLGNQTWTIQRHRQRRQTKQQAQHSHKKIRKKRCNDSYIIVIFNLTATVCNM
jgi:hypothetical protein